jgi:phosphoglycolate phosphatase
MTTEARRAGRATVTGPRPMRQIELVCLDMAGTTVADDGLVERAFVAALDAAGPADADERARMVQYTRDTMGQSKIAVFRALFGDEETAQKANAAFESAYDSAISSGGVRPIDGAAEAIAALRASGRKVALLTGFSPATRDKLIDALGWSEIADLVLCPAEAGRGRPAPDLVLTALLRLGASEVAAVAVAGDTASDIATGRAAGASVLVGVLTGFDDEERLYAAGATDVLASVAELPELLARPVDG